MTKKQSFGELASNDFEIGDIVEWSKWNPEEENYNANYGILLELTNKVMSNRIVSIAKVMSLGEDNSEREFFTLSLKLVSRKPREE